jgi:DNA-damage-inducible protein J
MSSTSLVQSRVDTDVKNEAEAIMQSLGLDAPTAIRMFYAAVVNNQGLPFAVRRPRFNEATEAAMEDARLRRDLHGPFTTAEAAIEDALKG